MVELECIVNHVYTVAYFLVITHVTSISYTLQLQYQHLLLCVCIITVKCKPLSDTGKNNSPPTHSHFEASMYSF